MLKIISTIGFLVTLVLFLNSDITVEILFVINIFFIIIFFYNPVSALKSAQRVSSEVAETKFGKNDLQELFINQIEDIIIILNKFNIITYINKAGIENFGTNVILSSRYSVFGLKNLSLKSFRRKNLDKLWKKHMNYN